MVTRIIFSNCGGFPIWCLWIYSRPISGESSAILILRSESIAFCGSAIISRSSLGHGFRFFGFGVAFLVIAVLLL